MPLVVVPKIVADMIISATIFGTTTRGFISATIFGTTTRGMCHYAASIVAHYHASNMAAVFSGCTLGEPHLDILIYKILAYTTSSQSPRTLGTGTPCSWRAFITRYSRSTACAEGSNFPGYTSEQYIIL